MHRIIFLLAAVYFAAAPNALAQEPSAAPAASYEVVKYDIDLEVAADGQSWQVADTRLRPLTAVGVKALQQATMSYTSGYQLLEVQAYTLKKDGRRIDIPASDMLRGHGETSAPGFEDTRTMTIVFPNLEIGDQAVTITRSVQVVPWFPNVFAATRIFPNAAVVRDGRFAFTTRGDGSEYRVAVSGVKEEAAISLGGKTRRVWRFTNEIPVKPEVGAVEEISHAPRVEITNLRDHASVAKIYSDLFRDRADVTPEIAALAEKLTAGIRGRREQAKVLYDWVATRIEYVNIVLGAGGFRPHRAADVLKNGYGDCKDHVMLLQALLTAKGIKSSAVLIRANANQFELPLPSPFLFDHLISYIPEFKLFLDSTARHAPFGVLPSSDAGKSVLIVETGTTAVTPPDTMALSSVTLDATIKFNPDGSADGDARVLSTGTDAIDARAAMTSLPPDGDAEFFRAVLGPGADGTLERGKPDVLDASYAYSARFHLPRVASFPGPGAFPALLGYKPFSFSALVASDLPARRDQDYVCPSGQYRQNLTITLPPGVSVTSLPQGVALKTQGVNLQTEYTLSQPDTVRVQVRLDLDRPGPVCRAADYAKVRPVLSEMMRALMAQILYR